MILIITNYNKEAKRQRTQFSPARNSDAPFPFPVLMNTYRLFNVSIMDALNSHDESDRKCWVYHAPKMPQRKKALMWRLIFGFESYHMYII